jgi:hypothetical protein
MKFVDIKIIEGVFSLRDVGYLCIFGLLIGMQIGSGVGNWNNIKTLFKFMF